jgi:hypothetical protein
MLIVVVSILIVPSAVPIEQEDVLAISNGKTTPV